jgi:hypothetical protein
MPRVMGQVLIMRPHLISEGGDPPLWVLLLVLLAAGCGPSGGTGQKSRSNLLFETMPGEVRHSLFPMAEIDVATEIRQITSDSTEAPKNVEPYVTPGRRVQGWICQLKRAGSNRGVGGAPSDVESSDFDEIVLLFPELVVGYQVWIKGSTRDPRSRQNSIPNDVFLHIKEGDWVRVSGVFRDDSKLRWEFMKSPVGLPAGQSAYLSLGEITVSSLERLTERKKDVIR